MPRPCAASGDDQDGDPPDRRIAMDGGHRMNTGEPDDLLIEGRDHAAASCFGKCRNSLANALLGPRRGRGAHQLDKGASICWLGLTDLRHRLRLGLGWRLVLRGRGVVFGAGSRPLAAPRSLVGLRFLGSTATSSEAPQSWRRDCEDSPRPPPVFRLGPFASIPNTDLPDASVSPTLPKRRLPGVRTRERTSLRPRLRGGFGEFVDARAVHILSIT